MMASVSAATPTPENLLNNGNLSVGSGDSVDGWRTEAWVQDEGTTDYHWIPPQNGNLGEVEVFTHRDNDARWQQQLSLSEGWYHVSVEARTRGVQQFRIGANVSLLDGSISSVDLRGDSDWHRLDFYVKVGPKGADVDVCLRLGSYGNLTRGQAFFRDARVERIAMPPPGADHLFDLSQVRQAQITPPIGRPWTLWATLVFLTALGAMGWWLMSEPLKVRSVVASPAAVSLPRGNKRKKSARAR